MVEIVTLSIQAAGGVRTHLRSCTLLVIVLTATRQALAATVNGRKQFLMGTHIMTAGTALQFATSVFFTGFFLVYYRRLSYRTDNPYSLRRNLGRIFWGTLLTELFLIIR